MKATGRMRWMRQSGWIQAWDIVIDRVQFSAEREELRDGKTSIARLMSFIETADRSEALAELSEAKKHWADIGQ